MTVEREDISLGDYIRCKDENGCIYTAWVVSIDVRDISCVIDNIEVTGQTTCGRPRYYFTIGPNYADKAVKFVGRSPEYWMGRYGSFPNFKPKGEWIVEKLSPSTKRSGEIAEVDLNQARKAAWGEDNYVAPAGSWSEFL